MDGWLTVDRLWMVGGFWIDGWMDGGWMEDGLMVDR